MKSPANFTAPPHLDLNSPPPTSLPTTHRPQDLTYFAALQHLMPEFEELGVEVVAASADSRAKACGFVDDLRGAVLAVSPDTRAGRIHFKVAYGCAVSAI